MSHLIKHHRLLARVTAPATEPLTLNESKDYLRVDHSNDDVLITDMIVSARMSAESWLRRSLISQSWKLGYDECLPVEVGMPMGPVDSVDNITITTRDGAQEVISNSIYYLNTAKTVLKLDNELNGFHIEITYNTGYGTTANDVPAPIRQGLLCHIALLYDHKGADADIAIPEQSYRLYMPYREVLL